MARYGGQRDSGCHLTARRPRGYHTAKPLEHACRSTPSAICSASRPSARATGRRSAAWSTAARRGIPLTEADIQPYLDKRRPGQSRFTTQRQEPDTVRILSGVFADEATGGQVTTGTPIALLIENVDQRSKDYSDIKDKYRPGHADYTYDVKYGMRDYRGGGRASARETAMRVAAGAIARKIVPGMTRARRAGPDGPAQDRPRALGLGRGRAQSVLLPGRAAGRAVFDDYLDGVRKRGSSVGAVIEVVAEGVPAGPRRAGLRQARRRSRRRR